MGAEPHFRFMVLTPAGTPEAALAIAGSRAGALGVLNLEFAHDAAAALAALDRLAAMGRGERGVLLDGGDDSLLAAVLDRPAAGIETIILTLGANDGDAARTAERLSQQVATIHAAGRRALVVAATLPAALAGAAAGADAIIAKGHEAGGWVGDETTFVLLQRLLQRVQVPVWAHGGVGLHTAAACFVAGAAGIVLDSQLLLTRESPLPDAVKSRIQMMDGSETVVLGAALGAAVRLYARPGLPAVEALRRHETACALMDAPTAARSAWCARVRQDVDWDGVEHRIVTTGQDAAFAAGLARRFGTVGGVLAGLRRAIDDHCASADRAHPLAEAAPLAQSHGTRYPIVQGPMTRVSDRAEFAAAVAQAGALPFLALALMRGPDVKDLLEETRSSLGERPWGVGILGFVPAELRAEQLEVIRAYRPPFALIAGGRPDQARALEADGVPTYLHVPSPGLLQMFLQEGAKRFVFEGRECGGHVGPRTSFVLWEAMVGVLLEHLPAGAKPGDYHVLFAGGIHDGLSAAMVAAIAGPLVDRGIRVGVLLGTAYLFTEEAVRAGAITQGFQDAALACDRTALLETGPGHATRCAPSPYVESFEQEKRQLLQDGVPAEELRNRLEELNIGRLRIASKGVDRNPGFGQDPAAPRLIAVPPEEQQRQGMYMIGQVAALRDRTCTLAELHHEVSATRTHRAVPAQASAGAPPAPPPAAVAIVGMGCILPGAADLQEFWHNILTKVDAITEVPPSRWDWRHYYDPDRRARDKVYSRWGGFVGEVPFDPVEFGMPPSTLPSIEPFQLLALAVTRAALKDAGYLDRPFARERTSVIFGAGGGGGDLSGGYVVRSSLPALFGESATDLTAQLNGTLPEWTEDSFAGILMNVAAGRIANRFDLGGVNYTVDAACASSLAAVYQAVRELEARTSDVVIVGGVDAIQNPFAFLCFSKTQALSPTGHCRTFDAQGDGIAIGEGFAALVMKRLEDAERDGDRIYGVIRAVGGSSDGRDRGLTAPRPEGQMRALERAYAQAGFSPATVELIEAHGTGTVVGDQTEIQSLTTYFAAAGAARQRCAVGSVKSMIGHTKATAGVAGLIKVALALHHRVLPPTLGVTQPNPKADFPSSPFYVNTEPRPWIQGEGDHPRRAGVSAFGFGGTNFHVVVEEYTGNFLPGHDAVLDPWPAELFLWRGESGAAIEQSLAGLLEKLEAGAAPALADLAYTLALQAGAAGADRPTLAIVASSLAELQEKLRAARAFLQGGAERRHEPHGIHYAARPLAGEGQVAFLFPGQGSQYVDMARDIALLFPEARASFERADRTLDGKLPQPLSRFVFPPPAFTKEEERERQAALTETNVAQPALGAADMALYRVLESLGVAPQMVAGHSYGEFVALSAAGCFGEDVLFQLSEARGRFIREGATTESGTMAAVDADAATLQPLFAGTDVTLANLNAPRQTVISGPRASVEQAIVDLGARGIRARLLPVACAFHSPLVAPAQQRLEALLRQTAMASPRLPVFSNTTAAAYPADPAAIVDILGQHLVRPVRFVDQITAMHDAGARIFVEVGPRAVVSGLVGRILDGRPQLCVSLDQPGRSGLEQLLHALAALAAEGCAVQADRLFRGRSVRRLELARLERETGRPHYTATTWLVNGGRARPANRQDAADDLPAKTLRVAVLEQDAVDSTADGTTGTSAGTAGPGTAPRNGPLATVSPRISGTPTTKDPVMRSPDTSQANTSQADTPHPVYQPQPPTQPQQAGATPHTSHARPVVAPAAGVAAALPQPAPAMPMPVPTASLAVSQPVTVLAAAPPAADGAGVIVRQFQDVMQRFLDTQKSVMLAYLRAHDGAVPSMQPALAAPASTVASLAPPLPVPAATYMPVAYRPAPPPAPAAVIPVATPQAAPNVPVPAAEHHEILSTAAIGLVTQPAPLPAQIAPVTHEAHPNGSENGHAAVAPLAVPAPPATPAVTATSPAAEAGPALDWAHLEQALLSVVSERTGYPPEMLGLDVDLEADLGIDSIKRVEIVGTFVRGLSLPEGTPIEMEQLTTSRSLRQILDHLLPMVAPPDPPEPPEPPPAREPVAARGGESAAESTRRPFEGGPAESAIGRFTLRADDAPAAGRDAGLAPAGAVIITDDETGVAEHLAAALAGRGHPVLRVRLAGAAVSPHPPTPSPTRGEGEHAGGPPTFRPLRWEEQQAAGPPTPPSPLVGEGLGVRDIDLSHPPAVAALVRQVREQHGAVAALVHLAALRPGTEALGTDPERWQLRLAGDLKGLFLLTQALHGDLERSGAGGGAVVLGASALGGAFASDRPSAPYFPGNGAITGFLKTVAEEWTGVRVKAVDLGPAPPATAAGWLLSEMMAADGLVEVGYRNGRRTCLRMEAAPLAPPAASRDAANRPAVDQDGASIMLDRDTVLLVTGGARGITAEAALVLAAAHKPTLLLVGRTPMPAEPEPPETAGITEAVALKRAIIESRRRAGAAVTPGQVEVAYRRILHEREMRENLARFERTGARVMYFPCDVRDAGAFGGLIDRIYEEYGRIDGVLHGAGVIEDKLVRDKTPDSFDRVVGTKVDSILTLAGKLRPESLRFVVFFGSVSGRFGNRGQADYAAASEVMNKLALDLDRRWPARVVSINWGPWLTTGMATPEIQRQFAARGVELIPVEVGCRMLEQELRFGSKGDVEVIVGGFPPAADRARTLPLVHSTGGHTRLRRTEDPRGGVELTRTLSLANDPYLDDHRLDGRPVLPMAIALELMVETARAGWPDLDLLEVRDLRLLHGITVDAAEHTVRVRAHPVAGPDSPTSRHDGRLFAPSAQSQSAGPRRLTLDLAIFSDDQPQRVHYQAVVELGDGQGTAPATDAERGPGPLGDAQPVPPSIDDAYRDWLFHGPRFRGITALDALGRSGLRARVRPSTPQALLANSPSGEWLVDPLLIDCALQLQLIWARHHWNVTSLPLGIRSYRPQSPRPAPAADGGEAPALQGEMRLRPGAQSPISLADHFVYAPDGRLLFRLEGVEMAGSTAANRLTGQGYREHQAATNETAGGV